MSTPIEIELLRTNFGEHERSFARSGALVATAFRYASGVEALRIENGAGHVTLLPFQGQQVWDAQFLGRDLTMRSMFEEPLPTRDYLRTYGAFFIHCGGTAMGNPGPADTHPLHGELPNLPYQEAQLTFGEDGGGRYAELTGSGRDTLAFSHDFVARPRLRLYEGSTVIEATIEVENRASKAMAFLYLAHINFRPVDGAVLIDSVADDRTDIALRQPVLDADASEAVRAYHEAVAADPSEHRRLTAGIAVEPELVLTMQVRADADGWAHALHRHPDGGGDFVSHRPAELPFAVRWLTRSGDQDALGLVLPATAAPDGLAAAREKGQLVMIEPGGRFRASMRFGAVDQTAARALEARIAIARQGAE
ncbi:MAG: DUF4432 family protein [Rhizobiaceae bacterium]|nr:DUF4432 family protein [Rhizobiaceae bacterium]